MYTSLVWLQLNIFLVSAFRVMMLLPSLVNYPIMVEEYLLLFAVFMI